MTALALVFAGFALRYQGLLLDYVLWGDEIEGIVAARMLVAGGTLYGDVFNHHGPLKFLTTYALELFGPAEIQSHRLAIAALQGIALVALYLSPLFRDGFVRRLYVIAAASIMLLYLPELYGHMVKYQALAGLLLMIILAQYSLVALCCPERMTPARAAIGNLLIACLPALAFTYAPLALILFGISLSRAQLWPSLAGLALGIALNIGFLAWIGSISGYAVYHIYFNLKVFSQFATGGIGVDLIRQSFIHATSGKLMFLQAVVAILIFV
ncbi:MAG: hypothetical protein AAGI70_16170, partial [Pseudomonadota bacterium]